MDQQLDPDDLGRKEQQRPSQERRQRCRQDDRHMHGEQIHEGLTNVIEDFGLPGSDRGQVEFR